MMQLNSHINEKFKEKLKEIKVTDLDKKKK